MAPLDGNTNHALRSPGHRDIRVRLVLILLIGVQVEMFKFEATFETGSSYGILQFYALEPSAGSTVQTQGQPAPPHRVICCPRCVRIQPSTFKMFVERAFVLSLFIVWV